MADPKDGDKRLDVDIKRLGNGAKRLGVQGGDKQERLCRYETIPLLECGKRGWQRAPEHHALRVLLESVGFNTGSPNVPKSERSCISLLSADVDMVGVDKFERFPSPCDIPEELEEDETCERAPSPCNTPVELEEEEICGCI